MILRSEIKKSHVEYSTGARIGNIKDLIVDTTEKRWPVVGLLVSQGVNKKDIVVTPSGNSDITVTEKGRIIVTSDTTIEAPVIHASSKKSLMFHFIENTPVVTRDGEKIGKIFDAVIIDNIQPWAISKILVKVPGLKSRRLRIDVRHVGKITGDAIELVLTKDEIEGH